MTTIKELNNKLILVTPLLESYANSKLDDGWKLPLPTNITKFIRNQKVVAREGYLLIDGDADFTAQLSSSRSSKLVTKRMLQAIPVSTVTAEAKERFYNLVEKVYLFKLQNG